MCGTAPVATAKAGDDAAGLTAQAQAARAAEIAALLRAQLRSRAATATASLADDEAGVIIRCSVWVAVGGGGVPRHGLAHAAAALRGVEHALAELQRRLQRLREEFVCLDDGEAEALFGGWGTLEDAASLAERAACECSGEAEAAGRCCSALSCDSSVWVELPDPEAAAASLEAGSEAIQKFSESVQWLAAHRQAYIARAKAAMDVQEGAGPAFACTRPVRTCPGSPCGARSLAPKLVGNDATHGPAPRRPLLGGSCAWWGLLGPAARLVTQATAPSCVRSGQEVAWAGTRLAAEGLARKLRWRCQVPAACGVPGVLDALFQELDGFAARVARLHEELACLGDSAAEAAPPDADGSEGLPALLLAAATLQQAALSWKCRLLAPPEAYPIARAAARHQAAELSDFLEEAVAVGDALESRLLQLVARRCAAVSSLKVATEVAGAAAALAAGPP